MQTILGALGEAIIKADLTTYVDITCAVVNMSRFLGYMDFNCGTYKESWDEDQAGTGKVKVGGKLGPRIQALSPHFPTINT